MSPTVAILGLVIGVALLVTRMLGAIEDLPSGSPTATIGPTASVTGSLGSYDELAVGDCLDVPTADAFSEVLFVACDEPHDAEVVFAGDHPGSDEAYPDDAGFESYVDEQCVPAFEAYTGSVFEDQDVLDLGWFTPTESSWSFGNRVVHCYVTPLDGSKATVSYRGANP